MKSFNILLTFGMMVLYLSAFSQQKTVIKKSKDIFGNTVIEDNKGNKKTISKDIFGNTVIEDNKGNKKTIGKDIFGNAIIGSNQARYKIGRDIFGNLEYEQNYQRRAYLKKDIFDAWIFTDANNNELAYSKEFWADINRASSGNEESVFLDMIAMCRNAKNYKGKYSVDIFGNLQFANSYNEKASLSKDIFNQFIYEDSKGNKITYSADEWTYGCDRFSSDKQAFLYLIDKYLFN